MASDWRLDEEVTADVQGTKLLPLCMRMQMRHYGEGGCAGNIRSEGNVRSDCGAGDEMIN